MKPARILSLIIILSIITLSCANKSKAPAVIWTDRSEFVAYTELFNLDQDRYTVVVEYRENPASALITSKEQPDIVVGPWLKGENTRKKLTAVDYLFNELRIKTNIFYPQLLELGNIRGRQYLLPVSYNLPSVIYSKEKQTSIPGAFTLSLEAIRDLGGAYNTEQGGMYDRMGFSPRWDAEFLYLTARLFNIRFEEHSNLFSWNANGATDALSFIRTWTKSINASVRAEDDFAFKYLYDPAHKLVVEGKNLFSYLPSDDLFLIPTEKLKNIDFRWVEKNGEIPVMDEIIYLGLAKKAANLEAAEAFLIWFYNEKNQQRVLERSHDMGLMEQSFGIAGGFSSLKPVTEKVFPLFYPTLLGHLPPANSLSVPRILPNNWEILKEALVLPWLKEQAASPDGAGVKTLDDRVAAWLKAN